MMTLRGATTALITPMKDDGSVDYDGYRRLIQFQLEKGINGLLPLGTTGETPTLEDEEKEKIIALAVKEAGGRVPVLVGVGSNATASTIQNARRAQDLGADYLLIVTPYYNKPSNEGIVRHFQAVAEAVPTPIIVYNIQGRTGKNIDVATMDRLSQIAQVMGVKEASGDIAQAGDMVNTVARARRAEGKDFLVLSGDDAMTLPLGALGGDGVISVVSNLVPDRVVALARAVIEDDIALARSIHFELLPLFKDAFVETNPVPIKKAMQWAGLPAGPCRLPLAPLASASEIKLRASLKAIGLDF